MKKWVVWNTYNVEELDVIRTLPDGVVVPADPALYQNGEKKILARNYNGLFSSEAGALAVAMRECYRRYSFLGRRLQKCLEEKP